MIGDVLLNTPVVRALRQHYPQSYLAYCTEPIAAQVLRGNPWLDDILIQPRPATWRQQLAMVARVRQQRFDLVIDLMGNPRSALLTLLSGARHRLAFARFPRSLCYNYLVARQPEIVDYTVLERLRLLAPLGIHTTDTALDMVYPNEVGTEVVAFLQAHGIKLLVVACNTASALALPAIRRAVKVPVMGVIEPGSRAAVEIADR